MVSSRKVILLWRGLLVREYETSVNMIPFIT